MPYLDEKNVEVEEVEELNIYFFRGKSGVEDFGPLMGKLYSSIVAENLTPTGPPRTFYHESELDPEDFSIEVAMPIEEVVDQSRKLPKYKLATITYKGVYSNIPRAYSILGDWVKKNKYEIVDSPYEIYMTDPDTTKAEDNIIKVCFPIEIL